MPAQFADTRTRAFELMQARDKVRLVCRHTGAFLHLSGTGTTQDITWSWLGYRHQADTLKSRAVTRGEDWTFRAVHRDDADFKREDAR